MCRPVPRAFPAEQLKELTHWGSEASRKSQKSDVSAKKFRGPRFAEVSAFRRRSFGEEPEVRRFGEKLRAGAGRAGNRRGGLNVPGGNPRYFVNRRRRLGGVL